MTNPDPWQHADWYWAFWPLVLALAVAGFWRIDKHLRGIREEIREMRSLLQKGNEK